MLGVKHVRLAAVSGVVSSIKYFVHLLLSLFQVLSRVFFIVSYVMLMLQILQKIHLQGL